MKKLPLEPLTGTWQGTIKISDVLGLRVALRVGQSKTGQLSATLESLDQGATNFKLDSISLRDGRLQFSIDRLGAEFLGVLDTGGTIAEGEWRQRGMFLPLTLTRSHGSGLKFLRPQAPQRPYPYREEEVAYESEAGGVSLAGTLTVPKDEGQPPALLLISGSGAQDRDGTLLGHKPFLVLADYLTRKGVAILRVDDRGIGGSTGNLANSTSINLAEDVLGGVRFLGARKDINAKKIGVLGHSEGGLVGALAAARCASIAFLVLMGAPGLPGEEILQMQRRLIHMRANTRRELINWEENLIDRLLTVLKTGVDDQEAKAAMGIIVQEEMGRFPEKERNDRGDVSRLLDAEVARMCTPWFRFFLSYDPRPTLVNVCCPVLAVTGAMDLQVPSKPNLMEIDQALRRGGNARVRVEELANLNHLFQTSEGETPSEYGEIQETIAPAALDLIGDWILEQISR